MQGSNLKILIFCLGFGFTTQAQQLVHLKGNIGNFKNSRDTVRYISTSVLDLVTFNDMESSFPVKSTGIFSFSLPFQRAQYIEITYSGTRFSAFARPGDTIHIRFNSDSIRESLKFSKDEALLNNEMNRYNLALEKFRRAQAGAFNAQYEKTKNFPELYKKVAYEYLVKNQEFLKKYSDSNKTSKVFKTHAATNLKYSTAFDLMRYGKGHSVTSDSFYFFLKDFPPDNASAAYSGMYIWFLNEYMVYLSTNKEATDDFVSFLLKEKKGFLLDLLFSWHMYQFMEADLLEGMQQYLPAYQKAVRNNGMKMQILALYKQKQQELAQAKLSDGSHLNLVPENAGQRLFQTITEKYKGRVVYIDLWGTWCVPCIEEMPNAKKLQLALAGKDVVFLYMAVQSPEATWKQVIAKLDIQGEHYLLKDAEFQLLKSTFQIQGVPHYVLVDRDGRITEKNTLPPGDAALKEKIEELLK